MMNEEALWKQHLPPGFTARPSTMADVQAATDLFNASAMKYSGRPIFSLEETVAFWQSPGYDLTRNSRAILDADGRLVAQIDVDDTAAVPVWPRAWGRVQPDFEGLGIGRAILLWAESCAQNVFPRVPADDQGIQLFVPVVPRTAHTSI